MQQILKKIEKTSNLSKFRTKNDKVFENIKNILPWATKIEICPAVCTDCDQDAYFTEAMFDINNATAD